MKEIIEKFFRTLQQTQFLPPQQLVAYQRRQLEPLLRHARTNVPFYRDSGRLDPLFSHDGTIDWNRWPEIPLLTRQDIQSSPEALKSENIPKGHGEPVSFATSGSSGEPVKIISTPLARGPTWAAARLRDLHWHRIDTTQRLAFVIPPNAHSTASDQVNKAAGRRSTNWYRALAQLIPDGERFDISDLLPAAELLAEIIELRPRYLHMQPTALELIMAHDVEQRLREFGIDAVFTHGETVSDEFKAHVESRLNTRLLTIYASTECGVMGGTCPHCGRIHLHAELANVELISDANEPAAPGEVGRVVATPFYNYAMPLIRYDHEDYARRGEPGQCRITLPTFDKLIGKQRPPFVFPDGRTIRPTLPAQWAIDCLGAKMYQVAQVSEDRCDFRIVPGTMAPSDMRLDEMTLLLRSAWWDGLQIDYKIMDALPRRSARAKAQSLVQEMPSVKPALVSHDG